VPAIRSRRVLAVRALGAASGAALVIAVAVASQAGHAPSKARPRALPAVVSPGGLLQRSGVRVVRVAVTGGGGLLDLRFQVVDPDLAVAVHDADTPPALVDERTGGAITALLMGHAHHGRLKAGVTYYLVFENPGNLVRRGDRVSVVLGDARVAHVLVQ
jgi:hypothetical protein